MDFKFYLTLLLRRLHYVILLTVMGAALGVTVAMILPPRYLSKALLVVESEQIPDELAASTVRTEALEQLQIIRQRILARNTLLGLVEQFDLYPIVPGEARAPDEIVADMRQRITIDTSGASRGNQSGATLVSVGFEASDAALSAAVANEVVTLILQENVEIRTKVSGETLDFFQREVRRLDQELVERSAAVVSFQENNREALPESLEFRRNQLIVGQERQLEIQRELEQLRDRRRSLEALVETGRTNPENQAALTPEARELQRLQDQYASSSVVMSDENPRMKILKAQITALEEVVAEQDAAAEPGSVGGLSSYDLQIADIDNQIRFLEARSAQIDTEIETLRSTIEATPNNAIRLQALQRDLESVRAQYDRAVENRARAETGDTIEALSKGQRISIIENATAPSEPNSPNRRKIALAGFGGGLLAGLGLVALLELLNGSVRRSSEIVEALEITPIATISYMRTRGEILRRRALIGVALLTVGAGIPAGIWAVDTYYRPVDLLVEDVMRKLPDIPGLTGPIGAL